MPDLLVNETTLTEICLKHEGISSVLPGFFLKNSNSMRFSEVDKLV